MFRLLAVLLIALALGFCAPEPSESAGLLVPGIFSPEPQFAPACDAGTDDLGATSAKTTVVALSAGRSDIAPADPKPSSVSVLRAASAPHQLAFDVPTSRAPPLA